MHVPLLQIVGGVHALPHTPQFPLSVCKFASQPSLAVPLQSLQFGIHTIPHAPAVQTGLAFGAAEQMEPQLPQLLVSDPVATSQPSAGL
jgi:hypothetical protein